VADALSARPVGSRLRGSSRKVESGCRHMEIRGSVPPDAVSAGGPIVAGGPPVNGGPVMDGGPPVDTGSAGTGAAVGGQAASTEPPVSAGPAVGGPAPPYPYEGVWRFTAPAVEPTVPRARRAVSDLLLRRGVPVHEDHLHGLLLIVSELVTNAVKHAALLSPEIGIEVSVGADWVRVAVEDSHPYRPKALETDQDNTGGRGLLLVKAITREAGGRCDVQHTASGGKVIWAALPFAVPGGDS
jgi:anti-sigma regulatory factor (Ser/Thr protein kinase)